MTAQTKSAQLERTLLIGVSTIHESMPVLLQHLEELKTLAETAGAEVEGIITQRLQHPHSKFFMGPGKLEEVRARIEEEKIDSVIADATLSPSQIKNLQDVLKVKVLDRTNLILDIFASRAQSAVAKTQVELAQLEYLLPRLTKQWMGLSRQGGGIGSRGPGEKVLESDRRALRNRILLLKDKIKSFDKQAETRRKSREGMVRVGLVGYTNAGKSTLMNAISGAGVEAVDKLFATLDTTVRNVNLDGQEFLLSDTVGFIRKLPAGLVESFKSTLAEVREADLLLHVVDAGNPQLAEHIATVEETLKQIKAEGKPTLLILNKIDTLQEDAFEGMSLAEKGESLERQYHKPDQPAIAISALHRQGIQKLRTLIARHVAEIRITRSFGVKV